MDFGKSFPTNPANSEIPTISNDPLATISFNPAHQLDEKKIRWYLKVSPPKNINWPDKWPDKWPEKKPQKPNKWPNHLPRWDDFPPYPEDPWHPWNPTYPVDDFWPYPVFK